MSSKTLDLSYLIWGFSLEALSFTQISPEQRLSELKSVVSKECSLAQGVFALRKLCRELPEGTVYPDVVINIQALPTLPLGDIVGDHFDTASPNNAPHFVVYVFDPTWMEIHFSDKIELSCAFSGGTSTSRFQITISKKLKITDLKARIKDAQPILKTAELAQIELYDVAVPNDVTERGDVLHNFIPSKTQLQSSLLLYEIFDSPSISCIHVIVKVTGRLQPESSTRNVMRHREEYYTSVHQRSIVPSSTAQPKQFREFQQKPAQALHCNRGPTDNATPPIPLTLLHPVFGTFMKECRTLVPSAEHNRFAAKFIGEMRVIYAQEDTKDDTIGRAPTVRDLFSEWGHPFQQSIIDAASGREFRTDGDLKEPLSGCRYGILEVRNEIGSGSAEPYAQASFYYQQACLKQSRKTSSVFPCLLVLVYGPHIAFAGAAWNVRPTIEILSVVPLFHDPHFPSDANIQTTVARHLLAMSHALQTLSDYYRTSYCDPPHDSISNQLFPYATSYSQGSQIESQKFEYLEQAQANLIFRGRLLNTSQNVWIKFVRRYSPEAHRFCQEKGHAPKLLGLQHLDGDWIMVVMEDLALNYLTLDATRAPLPASLMDGIRQMIGELHEAGFVHGDLRDLNIMVHKQDKDNFMIIDWDWAGMVQEARYPPNVNQEVKRPVGAIDGELILPAHDLDMLDYMEEAYWGNSGTVPRKRASAFAGEELPRKAPRTDLF